MKRIVAVADTHLKTWKIPEKLAKLMDDADAIIHAGDFDRYAVYRKFADYELVAVAGNEDDDRIKEELPEVATLKVDGVKIGVTHRGNYLNHFHDLGYRALELGVDLLVFGHLHRFVLERAKNVLLLCPGSPTQPRLSAASCAEIIVNGRKVDVKYHVVQPLFCGIDVIERMEGSS